MEQVANLNENTQVKSPLKIFVYVAIAAFGLGGWVVGLHTKLDYAVRSTDKNSSDIKDLSEIVIEVKTQTKIITDALSNGKISSRSRRHEN